MMVRSKSIGAVDYSQFRAGSSDSKCQGCQGKVLSIIPCHWLSSNNHFEFLPNYQKIVALNSPVLIIIDAHWGVLKFRKINDLFNGAPFPTLSHLQVFPTERLVTCFGTFHPPCFKCSKCTLRSIGFSSKKVILQRCSFAVSCFVDVWWLITAVSVSLNNIPNVYLQQFCLLTNSKFCP